MSISFFLVFFVVFAFFTIISRMEIWLHPFLLTFLLLALFSFVLAAFLKKGGFIPTIVGVVLLALYAINALLMGLPVLEVGVPPLILIFLLLPIILIKERKR